MKRAILAVALLLVPAVGQADEASRKEKAERLLELSKVDEMVDAMYTNMEQMWKAMAEQRAAKHGRRVRADEHMEKVLGLARETMNVETLKATMIEVYVKHYTDEELSDMIVFYESDTGRSMIEKAPAVMAEFMAKAQALSIESLPKLEALTEEYFAKAIGEEPAED